MDEITVVEAKPQLVLGMRKRRAYQEIPIMIMKVYEFAMSKNIEISSGPVFICHECTAEGAQKANQEKNADIEIVWPISKKAEGSEDIKCYELPGGKMAKIVHKGPYEEAGTTYEKLLAWLKENNKTLAGPIREAYLNDPREVPQSEILTEIYAPIE